jgi:hypothetical protein
MRSARRKLEETGDGESAEGGRDDPIGRVTDNRLNFLGTYVASNVLEGRSLEP